jgi:hypothetical protein
MKAIISCRLSYALRITLSATLDGPALKLHVLDSRGDFMTELKALEQRVARMCGVLLATCHGGE